MRRRLLRMLVFTGLFTGLFPGLFNGTAFGQESKLGAEFRRERERFGMECSSLHSLFGCATALFTDHPFHIAAGSLAPQNGFGAGAAFGTGWNTSRWRNSLNIDAAGSMNGSWRAGAYLNMGFARRSLTPTVQESPLWQTYIESTTLNKLTYFGLGPDTSTVNRSYYGMQETIVGTHAVLPLVPGLNLSLEAEMNGRFVDIRPATGQGSPTIAAVFTPASSPGLLNQPGFLQFGEGIRIRPSLAKGHIQLNYSARIQEFIAPGDSHYSFQRFVGSFSQEFPLLGKPVIRAVRPTNGPDDCSVSSNDPCPPLKPPPPPAPEARLGTVGLALMLSQSFTSGSNQVPFYFQPTLGGGDLNGSPSLGSYQDYRFRAPNTFLFRTSYERVVWGPFGVMGMVDWGKASFDHLDADHLRHSYSAGLTLRAGAFPLVQLLFSWGGKEGMRTSGRMDTSLLGTNSRPSLY